MPSRHFKNDKVEMKSGLMTSLLWFSKGTLCCGLDSIQCYELWQNWADNTDNWVTLWIGPIYIDTKLKWVRVQTQKKSWKSQIATNFVNDPVTKTTMITNFVNDPVTKALLTTLRSKYGQISRISPVTETTLINLFYTLHFRCL